jgi:hypothetical protein
MAFNINDMRSNLKFGGARPTLFQVTITNPVNPVADIQIPFLVRTTSLPAFNLGTVEVPYFGRKMKVVGDRTFEPWSTTVINDEDFSIRNSLEAWSSAMNTNLTNARNLPTSAPSEYKSTAQVIQFGKKGEILREYRFNGCWPSEISSIDLDWEQTDTIETFNVTWQYDWFDVTRGTTVDGTVI